MTVTKLADIELIDVGAHKPEDVVVMPDGTLYTGVEDGRLLRINPDRSVDTVANTGGRPLGLDQLADGRILICDTEKGLLAADPATGEVELLVPSGTHDLYFCNNPAVASDGRIYFTDSSQRYPIDKFRQDLIEAKPTGRLLCRYPDGRVEVLLTGLMFANGVALADDESFLFYVETGHDRISRLWLEGARKGQHEVIVPNLNGFPDNLSKGTSGLFWLAIPGPFTADLRKLLGAPKFVRYLVARLPERMLPVPEPLVRVIGFTEDGTIVHDIQGDETKFEQVTGVREVDGFLYLGSIGTTAIAKLDIRHLC